MTNRLYDHGREGILDETIRMKSGDIRVMLVLSGYQFNPEHQFLADLGAVDNGRSGPLTGKTFDAGVFDADDTSLIALATEPCVGLAYFQRTGLDGNARLICYVDVSDGLPVTPAAGQVVEVAHDNGADRIFKL